jgi:hypothetical protein
MLIDALVWWFQNPGTCLAVALAIVAAAYGIWQIVKKEN